MESLFLICSILHATSIFLFPTDTFLEKALLLSHSYHCWFVDKEDVKLFIILANVISLVFYLGHRAKEEPSRMI